MALKSKIFRGDSKLEAAAVSHSAHIQLGALGTHVAKIQRALIILDGAKISADGVYGPVTAASVLRYKQKRNIINTSYQSQADDIVGVMTMSSLDNEMSSRMDPTVIIGRVMFGIPADAVRSVAAAGSRIVASNIDVRSVVRGNPYVAAGVVPPVEMPPSVPPGKTYTVQITVDPPLTGSDFIELSIINSGAATGTASVSPARIQRSTPVIVTGGTQSKPASGGQLKIQAKLNGTEIKATSDGFTVCAHPVNVKCTFFRDINDSFAAGMIVADSLESDSNNFADLDEVEWSEVVERFSRSDPPFHDGSGFVNNSGYLPVIPPPGKFPGDTHDEPRPSAGPRGISEKIQLHIFKCHRCGAVDKAVPNSGFDITHEVFLVGKQWKHKVTKKGETIGVILPGTKTVVKTKPGSANITSPEHNLP
jgi:peptidoglycan hydrolase-like protein with peptidoglycan-binding domain